MSTSSNPDLGVVMPFWLDRPDEEAIEIALADQVAVVPSTSEDPAGRGVLGALTRDAVA
jgi:hypothetical protein